MCGKVLRLLGVTLNGKYANSMFRFVYSLFVWSRRHRVYAYAAIGTASTRMVVGVFFFLLKCKLQNANTTDMVRGFSVELFFCSLFYIYSTSTIGRITCTFVLYRINHFQNQHRLRSSHQSPSATPEYSNNPTQPR